MTALVNLVLTRIVALSHGEFELQKWITIPDMSDIPDEHCRPSLSSASFKDILSDSE